MKTTMKHCTSLLLAIATIATLTSCSNENDVPDGDCLPGEQYPVTLTAVGLQATPTSRATADGTWESNEEVAVLIGSEVKSYAAKGSGKSVTLEPINTKNTFYWQANNEKKTISAWYPHGTIPASGDKRPTHFTVQTNQSGTTSDGYQQSDFLYAAPVDVSFGNNAELTFKHLPAKVVINLKADTQNGVTIPEVEGATITLVNQASTSGTITYDVTTGAATVAQAATSIADVTPKTMTTGTGYQKTVQALLVPQQMKNKQFIKVTIGSGTDARDYYYTPTNDDANLQSGNQYIYEITVKKEGLSVSELSGKWTDKDLGSSDATQVTSFKIHLSAFTTPSHTKDFKVTDANGKILTATDGVYTAPSNEINVTISVDDGYYLKKFIKQGGICKEKGSYAAENNTYTCRFSDLRSDLYLEAEVDVYDESKLSKPKVGDYYYVDGTWTSDLLKPGFVAGIVFKVDKGEDDAASNYDNKLINNAIHGYAVALNDASTSAKWESGTPMVATEGTLNSLTAYNGYLITESLRNKKFDNGDSFESKYPAAYQCFTYQTQSAPVTSSGWYMPSVAQLKEVYAVHNAALSGKFGFADLTENNYWTSTYEPDINVHNGCTVYCVNWSNKESPTLEWKIQISTFEPY